MFNNDERYWDIGLLNKWFAISSIIFLAVTIWVFVDDNDDEFKDYQREFRKMEVEIAKKNTGLVPPKHMLNAPTELMKNLGYGKNYSYDHDFANSFSGQNYFPDEMERFSFYKPKETGFEREIIKRLQYWEKLRQDKE